MEKLAKAIAIGLGAVPATYIGIFAVFIGVPGGLFGAVGAYGFGVREQFAGTLLLVWALLSLFGVVSLWLAALRPEQATVIRALGLVGGIAAMFVGVDTFTARGTLEIRPINVWIVGGPIAVAISYLGYWAMQWMRKGTTHL